MILSEQQRGTKIEKKRTEIQNPEGKTKQSIICAIRVSEEEKKHEVEKYLKNP